MNFSTAFRILTLAFLSLFLTGQAFAQVRSTSRVPSLVDGGVPVVTNDTSLLVLRERAVQVNLSSLAKAASDGQRVIEVAFFDDAIFHIVVNRTEPTYSGGIAYVGSVLGSPLHPAVIVDNAGVISARVVANGRRYSLRGTPELGYITREHLVYDPPDHPKTTLDLTGGDFLPKRVSVSGAKSDPVPFPPPVAALDNNNIIDVMVVYTQSARAALGGTALANAEVDLEISITNTIYTNSSVVQSLRLVYRGEVTYTETNQSADLGRVTSPSDGFLDEVPVLRDLYKADFVSLWGNYASECGIGWLMAQERLSFQNLAYNVVGSPICTGPGVYTFAHELGHNMGLNHDVFPDPGTMTQVSPEGFPMDPGTTVIDYSRGYVDTVNRFRTVMAYNDACQALGFFCTRAPHFSNWMINYNNVAFYASAVNAPTGIAQANERLALNDTRETTQNFRSPALATLTGPGIVVFLPTTYTVAEGGGNAVLTVARHVGSTGAISVQYTTVNATATSGSDYTLTSGPLNWADGDSANKTIMVPILQDTVLEGTETFTVSLTTPTGGASIGSAGGVSQSATVRITDDEPDNFPVNALLPGGFVSAGSAWSVEPSDGSSSPMSLRSAQVFSGVNTTVAASMATSDIDYTGVFRAGDVSFSLRVSSYQSGFSGFDFLVDGVVLFTQAGGEVAWANVTRTLTAGTHTLRWRFRNGLSFPCNSVNPPAQGGSNCASRAYIDNVVLPLSRPFDLSGEGRTDLVWQNADGRQAIWLMNGTAPTATAEIIGAGTGWSVVQVADMDGNGRNDLIWQHTDGRIAVYLMNGTVPTATQQILSAGGGWSAIHAPDLNGDGKADIVFQNTDGRVAVWTMNGTTMTGGATIFGAGTGWSVIKTGDFDGDGKDDLVWRHTDGRHAIWLMNGVAVKSTAQILSAGGWTVKHAPDLNGDGRADIVWQHTDGTIAAWLMNGTMMTSGTTVLGAGTGFSVTRTGDFDGDGKADLFFLHTDGRAAIWLMNGLTPKQTAQILGAGGGWSAKRLGDLNGDGKADIVWENVDGRVAVWLMNGVGMTGGSTIFGAGSGWSVSGVSQ